MVNLKNGDGIAWPSHKRIAAMITFDFDAELLRYSTSGKENIEFADISRGQYGPHEGLARCLRVLRQQNIKTTFFVPGYIAEKYSQQVQQIISDGHEIGYHGYLHDSRLEIPYEEEAANMEKSEKILEAMYGKKIVGHRAPFGMLQQYGIELMQERGYLYSSVMKDRDWPYIHEISGGNSPIVELPTEHLLDDYTYFYFSFANPTNRSNYPVDYVFQIWKDCFDELANEGDKIFCLKLHPQLIGRASRARMLENFIAYMKANNAWIATCEEVAHYVKKYYEEQNKR